MWGSTQIIFWIWIFVQTFCSRNQHHHFLSGTIRLSFSFIFAFYFWRCSTFNATWHIVCNIFHSLIFWWSLMRYDFFFYFSFFFHAPHDVIHPFILPVFHSFCISYAYLIGWYRLSFFDRLNVKYAHNEYPKQIH